MPMPTVQHNPPSLVGLTPEVFTVSALLSMPAVWTAFVQRELPFGVLMERFLIVLLTCALLAELVRRLGEGGALGTTTLDPTPVPAPSRKTTASQVLFDDDLGLGTFEDYSPTTTPLDAPMDTTVIDVDGLDADLDATLDASRTDLPGDLAGLDGLDDLGDLGELPPLDLNADPFSDPV